MRPGNAERQKLALKEPGEVAKVIANTTREHDGLKGDRRYDCFLRCAGDFSASLKYGGELFIAYELSD